MSIRELLARLLLLVVLFSLAGYLIWDWVRSRSPEYRYRTGVAALANSDFDKSEEVADRLDASGASDWANLLRGRTYLQQGRYSKAAVSLSRVNSSGPLAKDAAFYSGEALLKLGRTRPAEQAFIFVLTEDPDRVDAHRYLAAMYYDQGDNSHALIHLQEVQRLDPADPRPLTLIGVIYTQLDQHSLAVETFRQALAGELPPTLREETNVNLGESLLKLFRYDEAIEAVKGMNSMRASLIRAGALTRQGHFAEARSQLDPWIARDPNDPRLLRQRGMIFLAEDRAADAVPPLERAAQLEPSDYTGQYQLGEALARAGQIERAAKQRARAEEVHLQIRKVVELSEEAAKDAWNPAPRIKLAELWKELGRPELSQMWRKAAMACEAGKGE